jgi:hypothetical protein
MIDCCAIEMTLDETVKMVYFPSTKKARRTSHCASILFRSLIDVSINEEIEAILYSSQVLPSTQVLESGIIKDGCIFCAEVLDPTDSNSPLSEVQTPWTQDLEEANGPSIIKDEAEAYGLLGYFNEPCAFMTFVDTTKDKKPVIFDTGASMAITHNKSDFDAGPLTIPKGDLRLGGMANGLKIEGLGSSVTRTFANDENEDVCFKGMTYYYVPQAKARLLSPQTRTFDAWTGM